MYNYLEHEKFFKQKKREKSKGMGSAIALGEELWGTHWGVTSEQNLGGKED